MLLEVWLKLREMIVTSDIDMSSLSPLELQQLTQVCIQSPKQYSYPYHPSAKFNSDDSVKLFRIYWTNPLQHVH